MPPLPESVQSALAHDAIVLTPGDRPARQLFAAYSRSSPDAVFRRPKIFALTVWLRALWSGLITEGHESRLLLNAAQEHLVWAEAIETGPRFESMGTLTQMAGMAAASWRRAAAVGLTAADLLRHAETHDARLFAAWAARFDSICERDGYLSLARLPAALQAQVQEGTVLLPRDLLLYGFPPSGSALAASLLPPAVDGLLQAFTGRGCRLQFVGTDTAAEGGALRARVAAPDARTEARTAARWIRQFVTNRAAAGLEHQVALVVPGLQEEAAALESTLREILAPELQHIAADASFAPFSIASGASLAQVPLCTVALDLLRWSSAPLPLTIVSTLLLSPYIDAPDTMGDRAAFDAFQLRASTHLRPELDLRSLGQVSGSRTPPAVLDVLRRWQTALSALAGARRRSYADWSEAFRMALRDAGWPGTRPRTALEHAAMQAFDHALDLVATLDFRSGTVSFADALAALERSCHEATAPLADARAPVNVLTPTEMAGCTFDAVVLLRMTDARWPVPEQPDPLIAFRLQRERNMPGANPGEAQVRAREWMAQLAASAPHVLAFYSERDAEGELRPSPLLEALRLRSLSTADLLPEEVPEAPVQVEELDDSAPLPALPDGQTRGGAGVLQAQAACAFHAFAQFRLNASEPDRPELGFSAGELGSFLHRSMENFWRETGSQAALSRMSTAQRRAQVDAAVAEAAAVHPTAVTAWDAAYLDLQCKRLSDVLMQWLDEELKRGPFTVVGREQDRELSVGPLTLKVRLDRVDAVEGDGGESGLLLVDYKTGRGGSVKDWATDRPESPQLPLYALLPEADNLQGLAYARVRAGREMKWQGHSATGVLPRPEPMTAATWEDQRAEWRQTLEALAQRFFDGDASVSPREYPGTCTYCAHRLLCRVGGPMVESAREETADASAPEDRADA